MMTEPNSRSSRRPLHAPRPWRVPLMSWSTRTRGRHWRAASAVVATAALALVSVPAFASDVDVAVVDTTIPVASVALAPGANTPITINLSVTGNQVGTATFEVYRDW